MKVTIKLAKNKFYTCRVKETSQLEAAAKVASRGFYGLMPVFSFTST